LSLFPDAVSEVILHDLFFQNKPVSCHNRVRDAQGGEAGDAKRYRSPERPDPEPAANQFFKK
jgi:hypothetical protein